MIDIEVCDCDQKKRFPAAAGHLCLHHVAAGFKDFQDVEKILVVVQFCFFFCFFSLITGCSLTGFLLLDSVWISPNNEAISVC